MTAAEVAYHLLALVGGIVVLVVAVGAMSAAVARWAHQPEVAGAVFWRLLIASAGAVPVGVLARPTAAWVAVLAAGVLAAQRWVLAPVVGSR